MLLKKNARFVWRLAMLCLLAFSTMNVIARYTPQTSQDLLDGVRGALLGAALGLVFVAGVIKRRDGRGGVGSSR
jgi:hypothetical protein